MIFNNKRIIPTILCLLSPESFARCKVPEKKDYQLIAAVMYSQLYLKKEELLKKLYLPKEMNTRWEKGPVLMTTSTKGLLKIEEKVGQLTENFVDEFGTDLFSKNLLEEPKSLKESTLIEIKDIIKSNFKEINVDNIKIENVEKEKKAYLDFLAERYAKRTYISDHRYGNIALHYVISNNKSEYIKKALGKKEDYQLFLKENKNYFLKKLITNLIIQF